MTPLDPSARPHRRRVRRGRFAGVASTALTLALMVPGSASGTAPSPSTTSATRPAGPAGAPASNTIRVMSFNILYGGDEVDPVGQGDHWCQRPAGCQATLDQVVAAIRAARADIVGIQEGTGNGCRIADALGWFCAPRLQVISRYPVIDPPGADGLYVYAEVTPGRMVALANVHLPSDPYGPYFPREGWTLQEVLDLETELRMPAIGEQLARLPALAAAGIPVVLTGDFNSPSHLDWTAAVTAARPVEVPYPIDWPVARALATAGFRDSYRSVHPDPVANPGFTWTAGYPRERKGVEVHDRIDWVLTAGPIQAVASEVVGEAAYSGTGIAVDPWPSDHRAVVSELSVIAGDPPSFAAVGSRRLFLGQSLGVAYHGAIAGDQVRIVRAGAPAAAAIASTAVVGDGVASFPSGAWSPGAYEAVLVRNGTIVGGRSLVDAYPVGTPTSVRTNRSSYAVGEPITVSWSAGPGWRWDWIAITKKGVSNVGVATDCTGGYCGQADYFVWDYTRTAVEGLLVIGAGAQPGTTEWPLKAGWYRATYYFDDGYALVAQSAPFRVVGK
jgi:endonuclease/exonuclease/phosphatase family metal-dependent hydrolase